MEKITKEEVLKIAELSRIEISDDEIEPIVKQLQDVLSYAQRVKEVAIDVREPLRKNVNIMREDVVIKTDSETILRQAPDREDNFFVVPIILNNK
ncbi:Asp-tRNA(Asn)/Glu-tRNA(Gln) amidotransferase subunit GatC [bacterium]|jgi:aspartyl-tRNA(Asn)/glutamyl-tRNA(Gln) amidotransferase subunit C|nr:Asp-tRNA(Asn)/Glu-tRNA(Gln) amidotransferase subunit GatC [bacterium]